DQPELDAAEDLGRNLGRVVANWRLLERERQLVEELQALDRYRTELIATISHELKTPLTAIIGHVELLEDADDGDISISAISRNAQRLDRLVANLLTYSHALHADIGDRRLINLNDVVGDGVELIRAQAEANQVELKLEHVSSENWVLGDPEELGKVVINLLSNAVKYSRSGGKVEISVDGNETYRELRVTDHGIGISKADQQNLFSAFNRSSNQEVLSIPGTGLGLAISRRIAQMNGGEILVDSDLGVGSSFRFRLPAQVSANGFTV
ncbi:MAG TPA: HAMP domain-containing sensor histidine kinase, partial [Marmoricola sp.]|nr:HAMP domain-containing sensor histidine kinase [Marmoricola sp.]